jgi:hypothetical protein
MFSVVQFIEGDQKLISAVPTSWIRQDGKLVRDYWPNSKVVTPLIKRAAPPQPCWKFLSCSVLATNLSSYNAAIQKEKDRTLYSNTEDEGNVNMTLQYNRKHPMAKYNSIIDMNSRFVGVDGSPSKKGKYKYSFKYL